MALICLYMKKLLIPCVAVLLVTNTLLVTDNVMKTIHNDRSRADPCDRHSHSIRTGHNERNFTTNKDNTTANLTATANLAVSKKYILSDNEHYMEKDRNTPLELMQDGRIDAMIAKLKAMTGRTLFPHYFWNSSLADLAKRFGAVARKTGKTLKAYSDLKTKTNMSNWQLVHHDVRQFALYNPNNPAVDGLLHDLATKKITDIDENDGGTQFKMILHFGDGGRAIFKPMRYPRHVEANPNHEVYYDPERHVAEISAFHLDRILGFYRVPPTVGRKVNLTSEIQKIAPENITDTFFISPAHNKCFYGVCDVYCDTPHAFCGDPDMLEGSVQGYLPSENFAPRKDWWSPWKRVYTKKWKLAWKTNDSFCDTVRYEPPFNNGKLLLDMIDAHTFDFLAGNKDRHSYETFEEFGNYSFPVLYDNGKGFGRQDYDVISILAPLRQCCMIRKSTFLKYMKLYTGPHRLSALMEKSLASDPVAPVLLPGHFNALDRRLKKILLAVAKCLESGLSVSSVIIADRF